MVHRVVADAMAAPFHLLVKLGMAGDIVAHHEECGFHAILVERVKHPGCDLGNRPVVESQEDDFLAVLLYAPYRLWEEEAVEQRRTLDKHWRRGVCVEDVAAPEGLPVGEVCLQVVEVDAFLGQRLADDVEVATLLGVELEQQVEVGRHIAVGGGEA